MTSIGAPPTRRTIAYQGEPGANSHLACEQAYPHDTPIACSTFEEAFASVSQGDTDLAMIPIDNTVAGRVADVHRLMQSADLFIVGEHFCRIHHHLMVVPGTALNDVKRVTSHTHALGQCRKTIADLGLEPVSAADTAGAAAALARSRDRKTAVIASEQAAEIYGLEIMRSSVEDEPHNTTRFVVLAATRCDEIPGGGPVITSLIFTLRNVPAALFTAMAGFASNGVNLTKLESYVDGSFNVAEFYVDVEGHPLDPPLRSALKQLTAFTTSLRHLGTYASSSHRTAVSG